MESTSAISAISTALLILSMSILFLLLLLWWFFRSPKEKKKKFKNQDKKQETVRPSTDVGTPKPLMMTKHQQELLEKIREIEDPAILALLMDGATQRVKRFDKTREPQASGTASLFATEVKKLYEKASRLSS